MYDTVDSVTAEVEYHYYPDGSLSDLILPGLHDTQPSTNAFHYTYDNNGLLSTTTTPRGKILTTVYDPYGRCIHQQLGTASADMASIGYDATEQVNALTNVGAVNTSSFTASSTTGAGLLSGITKAMHAPGGSYDAGRLSFGYNGNDYNSSVAFAPTQAGNRSPSPRTYTFDVAGNLQASVGGKTPGRAIGYDPRTDRIAGWLNNDGLAPDPGLANPLVAYDPEGRPTTYNGNVASYDANDGLTGYLGFTAGYRSDGLRAWKQVGSDPTTYFLYNSLPRSIGGDQLLAELDDSGNVTHYLTWTPDGLSGRTTVGSSTTVWYQHD